MDLADLLLLVMIVWIHLHQLLLEEHLLVLDLVEILHLRVERLLNVLGVRRNLLFVSTHLVLIDKGRILSIALLPHLLVTLCILSLVIYRLS